jgi:hypothetical protein
MLVAIGGVNFAAESFPEKKFYNNLQQDGVGFVGVWDEVEQKKRTRIISKTFQVYIISNYYFFSLFRSCFECFFYVCFAAHHSRHRSDEKQLSRAEGN